MQRILIVDLSKNFGGADVRVELIARELSPRFDISIAVIDGSQTHHRFKNLGVRLWPLSRSRRDPRLVPDLVRLMKRIRPDVVDAHNPQSLLWGLMAARAANVPIRIATFHSIFEVSEERRLGRLLYSGLNRLSDRLSTNVISVSDTVTDFLIRQGMSAKKITTIQNGVEIPEHRARSRAVDGRFRIASVGRLVPVKAHAVLLKALARIIPGVPGAECVIIGEGPERASLEQQAKTLGLSEQVQFAGFRNDAAQMLLECDVFCLPSLTEALPFAVLEAAALGMPLVVSRVGGLGTYFTDRDTAILVPSGDVGALAEALETCAGDMSAAWAMGERARRLIGEQFSIKRTLNETAHAYLGATGRVTAHSCGGVPAP